MQKILLLSVLLMFFSHVKSQDTIKATLITINNYATNIEETLFKINNSIKGKAVGIQQSTNDIQGTLNSIEKELQYLPDDYFNILSPVVDSFKADIDAFNKLAQNRESEVNNKLMNQAFGGLQQRQKELRNALKSAYSKALQQNENRMPESSANEVKEEDAASVQPAPNKDTTMVTEHAAPVNEDTAGTNKNSSNFIVLDSIHRAQKQIEDLIENIHAAMKKNNFTKVGTYAKDISNASLKISDLTFLLKSDQKENLLILSTGLKSLAETLHELAHKGTAAHHEIHETIDKMEIKYSTLTTGISLIH